MFHRLSVGVVSDRIANSQEQQNTWHLFWLYGRISSQDAQRRQVCVSDEASGQGHGVCVMAIPIVDLLFLIGTSVAAFLNRGTLIGWMCTLLVLWQVWNLIRFYKEHPWFFWYCTIYYLKNFPACFATPSSSWGGTRVPRCLWISPPAPKTAIFLRCWF